MRWTLFAIGVVLAGYAAGAAAADGNKNAYETNLLRQAYIAATVGESMPGFPAHVKITDSQPLGQNTIALYTVGQQGPVRRAIWLLTTNTECKQPRLSKGSIAYADAQGQTHACSLVAVQQVGEERLLGQLMARQLISTGPALLGFDAPLTASYSPSSGMAPGGRAW